MKLAVESDGDRYPKDVYLINEAGERVATIEGARETAKFHLARDLALGYNRLMELKPRSRPDQT
jgi:hypothetical protein